MTFYHLGSLVLLTVGACFLVYGSGMLLSARSTRLRAERAPLLALEVGIREVEVVSRFRWTEYAPVTYFRYMVGGREYTGGDQYIRGGVRYRDRSTAQRQVELLQGMREVFYDPRHPGTSFLVPDVSPQLRRNLHGIVAAGALLAAVSTALLAARLLGIF